jgi:DNA-directed RNA polymerase specialized sigma24 family protein
MAVQDSARTRDYKTVHDSALKRVRRNYNPVVWQNAEDIAQEVVLKYAEAARSQVIENPAAWANVAAWRLAVNLVRDREREQELFREEDPDESDDGERHQEDAKEMAFVEFIAHGQATSNIAILRQQADILMSQLDDRETEFVLLVASGYGQAEIAEILGYANADVVKATLNRKRNQLRAIADQAGLDVDWQDHPRVY